MRTGLRGRMISLNVCMSNTQLSGPGAGVLGSGRSVFQRVRERIYSCQVSDITAWGTEEALAGTRQFSRQPRALAGRHFKRGWVHARHVALCC